MDRVGWVIASGLALVMLLLLLCAPHLAMVP